MINGHHHPHGEQFSTALASTVPPIHNHSKVTTALTYNIIYNT